MSMMNTQGPAPQSVPSPTSGPGPPAQSQPGGAPQQPIGSTPAPPMGVAEPAGPPGPITTKWHDVTVRRKSKSHRTICLNVPPEEFGITRFARNIKNAGYVFHQTLKTEAQLIKEGYEEEQIQNLNTYAAMTNQEELARDTVEERQGTSGDGALNRSNREIQVTEHYIEIDYEQDGKPHLYRIVTGGDPSQILRRKVRDSEAYEEEICRMDGPPPFAVITPFPMPHRFFGRSVADLVMDIQRIKTVVLRAILDNTYQRSNPSLIISESHAGPSTFDDALTSRPNRLIRVRMPGGLEWQEVPDIATPMLPMMQLMDSMREWRSGVSRQGQSVDGEALQNQVATIANQMEDASQAKVKLIARIFAETGVKDLFWLLHDTLRRHGGAAATQRLRGRWVTVDPRAWQARSDLSINVGMGHGDKFRQLMSLQLIGALQEKIVTLGGSMVSPRNVYNFARELTKLARPGHDTERFFTDPSQPQNPADPAGTPFPPKPNPEMLKAQAAQQEIQGKLEIDQNRARQDMARDQMRMAIESKQAEADITSKQVEMSQKLAFEKEKHQGEIEREMLRMQMEQVKHQLTIRQDEEKHAQALQQKDEMHEVQLANKEETRKKVEGIRKTRQSNEDRRTKENQDHMAGLIKKLTDSHADLVKAINRPKKIKRDSKGKVEGVE